MLRFLYGRDISAEPTLADTMFRDRATQFHDRLGWDVDVDAHGWERDQYDALDPLYVIWQGPGGRHGGSMRFLPTTGRTMVNEHFAHLLEEREIRDPTIWECTRFCLAPDARGHVAAALMLGGGELMRHMPVRHFVGVFDARMERIYRLIGSRPEVLGRAGTGREAIGVGLWSFNAADRAALLARARVSDADICRWIAPLLRRFPAGCDAAA